MSAQSWESVATGRRHAKGAPVQQRPSPGGGIAATAALAAARALHRVARWLRAQCALSQWFWLQRDMPA